MNIRLLLSFFLSVFIVQGAYGMHNNFKIDLDKIENDETYEFQVLSPKSRKNDDLAVKSVYNKWLSVMQENLDDDNEKHDFSLLFRMLIFYCNESEQDSFLKEIHDLAPKFSKKDSPKRLQRRSSLLEKVLKEKLKDKSVLKREITTDTKKLGSPLSIALQQHKDKYFIVGLVTVLITNGAQVSKREKELINQSKYKKELNKLIKIKK